MPINKLGLRPPISSTEQTGIADSSPTTGGADFQGRRVSMVGSQQSASFLAAGDARQASHIFPSARGLIAERNISDRPVDRHDEIQSPGYEEMRQVHDSEEINSPSENSYLEIRSVVDAPKDD